MDGDGSLRLARALRNATRHTDVPFGNDVRTAYQLLGRVLQHESGQQGFDLAATRDANFHEVGGRGQVAPGGSLACPGPSRELRHLQGLGGQPGASLGCEGSSCPLSSRQSLTFPREPRPAVTSRTE